MRQQGLAYLKPQVLNDKMHEAQHASITTWQREYETTSAPTVRHSGTFIRLDDCTVLSIGQR